jgi:PHP family Zn ribbon phosphoesterase
MIVRADLHIHSTVSPCASLLMSPRNIVASARTKGLSLIALTDHNCTRNCPSFFSLCGKEKLACLGGAEVTTQEECHVLCLFEELSVVVEFGRYVEAHLPDVPNQADVFGDQVYVDDSDEILGSVEKYLGNATTISLTELCAHVHRHGGIVIPAHVDRPVFGMIGQLGFIPDESFDALEIYRAKVSRTKFEQMKYPLVSNSDAHIPDEIGCFYNEIEMPSISLMNLKEAFKNRTICIRQR